jgi:hypothetical protein
MGAEGRDGPLGRPRRAQRSRPTFFVTLGRQGMSSLWLKIPDGVLQSGQLKVHDRYVTGGNL